MSILDKCKSCSILYVMMGGGLQGWILYTLLVKIFENIYGGRWGYRLFLNRIKLGNSRNLYGGEGGKYINLWGDMGVRWAVTRNSHNISNGTALYIISYQRDVTELTCMELLVICIDPDLDLCPQSNHAYLNNRKKLRDHEILTSARLVKLQYSRALFLNFWKIFIG